VSNLGILARDVREVFRDELFIRYDPIGRQRQNIETSVTYESKIRRGCTGYPVVEERRVLNGVAIEALSSIAKHSGGYRGRKALHDVKDVGTVQQQD
jgi:hypothetical protein